MDFHVTNLATSNATLGIIWLHILKAFLEKIKDMFVLYYKLFYNCNRINYCVSLETAQKPPKTKITATQETPSKGADLLYAVKGDLAVS